ncbi:T6SS phospholipase effector Tle1-like catalytic domain-containing protein [Shewanella surugensis]|uniref:DUF2235 domain-containing protein n=1 Tax=Shewanella surugensis TaxID=212020 RepID=A0ABT0LIR6_9GAMM|nr:DUF2235 domain-containing protein [Shewanella surugensis]MCL1127565.1 DUF2235 domain-containing protein [Shewanella surugensis]
MFIRIIKAVATLCLLIMMASCSSNKTYTVEIHQPNKDNHNIKQLALFLDGTQNDRDSRTNVSALNEIIKHQDKDNLYLFYNEGVGTDGRIIGAGWGNDKDVAEAYAFLSRYYSQDALLYIFGFSRGAYASRILAGMIYALGIYDLSDFSEEDRLQLSKALYAIYKGEDKDIEESRFQANQLINQWGQDTLKLDGFALNHHVANVSIEILGLWDTVEALGFVPTLEAANETYFGVADPKNIVNPNPRYIDQICNINHVYHAVSLDDNRANVFTPIIISSNEVVSLCSESQDSSISKVEEVWFSGAHADVGGGYEKMENNKSDDHMDKDLALSGLSLNWMLDNIKRDAPTLLPDFAQVHQNAFAHVHDAENTDAKYKRVLRNSILTSYLDVSRYEKINIHHSVLERIALPPNNNQEVLSRGFDSYWYQAPYFFDCFEVNEVQGYRFTPCNKIEPVGEDALPRVQQ